MIQSGPILLRFAEIERLRDILKQYQDADVKVFSSDPAIFGGAARFIQLIGKYTIEIAGQIAHHKNLAYKGFNQLFEQMLVIGAIDQAQLGDLQILSGYYLEKTLRAMKVADLYSMLGRIDKISVSYAGSIKGYLKRDV